MNIYGLEIITNPALAAGNLILLSGALDIFAHEGQQASLDLMKITSTSNVTVTAIWACPAISLITDQGLSQRSVLLE